MTDDTQVDLIQLSDILQILHSVRNARHINLPDFGLCDINHSTNLGSNFPVHVPHLLHLWTKFSAIPLIIDAPFLHSLEITSSSNAPLKPLHIPNNFARNVDTLDITGEAFNNLVVQQPGHWNSVKNVIWTSEEPLIGVNTTPFQSICSVEFVGGRPLGRFNAITNNMNNFLVALLRYPDACPRLRTIRSDRYPVWALLIQVLLQRNRSQDIAQLEEICFPGLPIRPLLSLIVRLLNGSSNEVIPTIIDHILMRRYKHSLL
jgi:hypothetical protein